MADYLASHDREAMRWAIQSADCARDALASAERERSHRARSQRATWTSEDSEHWLGTRVTPLGMRWTIERTNSWLSNFGQLRRSDGDH